jgi:hypothetical protein
MKKIIFITASFGIMIILASCAKDYSCTCNFNPTIGTDTSITLQYPDVKKSEAEESCAAAEATYSILDPEAHCHLD